MAISYGFFNSVNDDRLYNAETFNTYFEGLVSKNGVYENVESKLAVTAGTSGLTVKVGAGKAVVNNHWVKLTAAETLTLDTANNLFDRYDKISLRWNNASRTVTLQAMTGTPSSTPTRAPATRNTDYYEIVLAYVLVKANATTITTANIYDQRPNTAICGYVTGLIKQVDIAELFAQYTARFVQLENQMKNWQNTQKNLFNAWYYELTENLTVGAYIKQFTKTVNGGQNVSSAIPLNMSGYTYEENDVLLPTVNGLRLIPNVDYTLDTSGTPVIMNVNTELTAGNVFNLVVLKSNMSQTEGGILSSARGETMIHVDDAEPGTAHGFTIATLGTTNEIAVTNRNLFRGDLLDTDSIAGLTFTKNSNGSYTVAGTTTESLVSIGAYIDKNQFVVGQTYTLNSGKTEGEVYIKLTLNYADDTTEDFMSKNAIRVFTIEKAVVSAIVAICVTGLGTAVNNELVKPQLEVGGTAHEFVKNSYVTFTYDGSRKPVLTDTINNIWSNDDAVRDMTLVYFVYGISDGDDISY